MMAETKSTPWHAQYPTPTSTPPSITVEEVHENLKQQGGSRDFLIVDVRRTDIEEEAAFLIPTAINLPAQTFYTTLPALLPILSRYKSVIFHCSSSNGRGPRCAAWYQDELNKRSVETSKALVLKGGIKTWAQSYPEEIVRV